MTSPHEGQPRRSWVAALIVSALVLALAVLVAGCGGSSSTTTTGGDSPTTARSQPTVTTAESTPSTEDVPVGEGATPITDGAPVYATSLLSGPIALGMLRVDAGDTPTAWFLTSDGAWEAEQIDTAIRWPVAAAELDDGALLGDRLLVVGYDDRGDDQLSDPEHSFAAIRNEGGGWDVVDPGANLPAGTSLELLALGVTGDPRDMNTFFMAVGATKSGAPTSRYLSEDITGATPIAMISLNGMDWNPPVELPLPGDVSEATATSVAFCGPDTQAHGMVAVGYGYIADKKLGARMVGLVWRSTDNGSTWKVVADDTFSEFGKNISARFVATDGANVVVAGQVDALAGSAVEGDAEQSTALWSIESDGSWTRTTDGSSVDGLVSSVATALYAQDSQDGRTFIQATQRYDTGLGSTDPGADSVSGDPEVVINASIDGGRTWKTMETLFPGQQQAALIDGMFVTSAFMGFVGIDKSGRGMSWSLGGSAGN